MLSYALKDSSMWVDPGKEQIRSRWPWVFQIAQTQFPLKNTPQSLICLNCMHDDRSLRSHSLIWVLEGLHLCEVGLN